MGYHLTIADAVDFRDNGPADPVTKYTVCHSKTAWGPIFIWVLSTKYTDSESGLVYYGFRFYVPEMGRWVSKDPLWEKGGRDSSNQKFIEILAPLISRNLYIFAKNTSIGRVDTLGEVDVNYSLDLARVPNVGSGKTDSSGMSLLCACSVQPENASQCPCKYMMKCRIDVPLHIRINSDDAFLKDINETFQSVLRHEFLHVLAFFAFAENFAKSIDHLDYERRCYGGFDRCYDTKDAIKASWNTQLGNLRYQQYYHTDGWNGYNPVNPDIWDVIRDQVRGNLL